MNAQREPLVRQCAREARFVVVDLTGSRMGEGWLSVELELSLDPEHWPDERIREEAAEHYDIPVEQVGSVTLWPTRDDG